MADIQAVEPFEWNGFVLIEFLVPEFGGRKLKQSNLSAHLVRDG